MSGAQWDDGGDRARLGVICVPAEDLAAARRGDNAAFGRLVDWCEAEGWRLACSYVGDEDVAADMWQDALLVAWGRLREFEGTADQFRGWLMTILVNRCRNQLRDDRRAVADWRDRQDRADASERSIRCAACGLRFFSRRSRRQYSSRKTDTLRRPTE